MIVKIMIDGLLMVLEPKLVFVFELADLFKLLANVEKQLSILGNRAPDGET